MHRRSWQHSEVGGVRCRVVAKPTSAKIKTDKIDATVLALAGTSLSYFFGKRTA